MPERTKYISPIDAIDPEKNKKGFNRIETYTGTVRNVIADIDKGITKLEAGRQTEEDAVELFYLTSKMIKMSVEEKIEADRGKKGYVEEAIRVVGLTVDLATSCDLRDEGARAVFDDLKGAIEEENSPLITMLEKKLSEAPDPGIMPEHPGEADLALAKKLLKDITDKGLEEKDILVIGIGHRGLRRALNIFLDYCSESGSTNSRFWPVRLSPHYGDKFPNFSWQEIDMLTKEAENKTVVVIGPEDRTDKVKKYLCFNGITSFKEKGDVTDVPLPLKHTSEEKIKSKQKLQPRLTRRIETMK